MYRRFITLSFATAAAFAVATPASAAPPTTPLSGAIFTTDVTGVPVNLNIYAAKEDVYLNGGPGINAPDDAAGLPAGPYSFQVTDPSGKTLLSTDSVTCRQFTVDASGRIQSVAPSGACAHATGTDGEDLGITVQLFPYNDTPNNGGVYKVWVSPTELLDCSAPATRTASSRGTARPTTTRPPNWSPPASTCAPSPAGWATAAGSDDAPRLQRLDARGGQPSSHYPRCSAACAARFERDFERRLHVDRRTR